ncbi:MAG: GAF and ANTAR domain-containing protein [Actinomycetota bacterium]|nr:GAF and ANTAR domain-containing protein [Actinomycetota bacterium]
MELSPPSFQQRSSNGAVDTVLTERLSELTELLLSDEGVQDVLEQTARVAADTIAPATGCGITLRPDNRPLTVAGSGALASLLDELQYEGDAGPCLESMRTHAAVSSPDLADETRWSGYPAMAVAAGARSVLSLPLHVREKNVGALNFYSDTPHAFDAGPDVALAGLFAAQVAIVLTAAMRFSDQVELAEQLRTAMTSRAVIDQAIGLVIGQRRCSPDEAFATLRAISQRRNVKLRIVAQELVDAAQSSAPRPGGTEPANSQLTSGQRVNGQPANGRRANGQPAT